MSVLKQLFSCLLAVLSLQVLTTSARQIPNDDESVVTLETRGLFDLVTNPLGTVRNGVQRVDNSVTSAREAGSDAVVGSVGRGVGLATGLNPAALTEIPKAVAKTAIQGARQGTQATATATDRTLDTVLDMHDRKKQILEEYVVPVAPTMVSNAINNVNDRFDSTVSSMKDGVQTGKDRVVNRLDAMENWLDQGKLQDAVRSTVEGLGTAGKTATGWLSSFVPWSGSALPGNKVIGQGLAGVPGQGQANLLSLGQGQGQASLPVQGNQVQSQAQAAAATARTGLSRFLPW